MKAVQINISGRVQGVGFRHSAVKTANQLRVKGYVKNNPGGSVLIEAEGNEDALNKFVKWCYQGPAFARVQDVQLKDIGTKGYKTFDIKY